MENNLLKRVRKIEIKTKALSRELFSGEYHSAFKGRGMIFSEVREYQYGDDIRSIDWNVTARFNHPYIKKYQEERELTVMLLIDVSGSTLFGTKKVFKKELIAEVAATIAFSAIQNNDKVGVIFFSDCIEKYIPPKKGSAHILRIIRELIFFKPQECKTDLADALKYFSDGVKKKCTAFILSDFYSEGFENALKIAAQKHDLIAIQILDKKELSLPNFGLVYLLDPETKEKIWVDSSSTRIQKAFSSKIEEHQTRLKKTLKKTEVDYVQLTTDSDYLKPLLMLFKQRGLKH